jgi:NAD(P)-dependent dehydrogenase (short-subunit alcohol dehydrogenase family)
MTSDSSPVWFITGCSTGLGRALAEAVLARGWRAVVTARRQADVADVVHGAGSRALALDLDVTDAAAIKAAVAAAEARFGGIDVLVNNAGYGYQTSVEEADETEIRALFEANAFGLFALTRAVLPGMRARRRGHIISITSLAGFVGFAASGYYAATKHAVEGWSDSLAAEVGPLGIKVTCVAPGPFRTDWAGRSLHVTPSVIADYANTVAARQKAMALRGKTQPGDPARAAAAMIRITEIDNPPRHLVLGAVALDGVTSKLKQRLAEIEAWREVGLATDFPKE